MLGVKQFMCLAAEGLSKEFLICLLHFRILMGITKRPLFYTLDQAPRSKGAAMTASAFSAIEDIQEESALDSLLAQAMEPTAAVFQAGADSVHVGREKEINGILTA